MRNYDMSMEEPTDVTSLRHRVIIAANAQGRPKIDAEFGRVTAIMGANGTGKSQLLRSLRSEGPFVDRLTRVLVEGGRLVHFPPDLPTHVGSRGPLNEWNLQQRLMDILNRLLEGRLNDTQYIKLLEQWDGKPPKPHRGRPRINDLFQLFSEIFPSIRLTLEHPDGGYGGRIGCRASGDRYQLNQLSDGEQQIFCLLGDLIFGVQGKRVFLVDEPELHLHPRLADSFWTLVEESRPESVFVYATHSLSFAMRKSIDTRIVLSKPGEPAVLLQSLDELSRSDARDFLGAIPAILRANHALAVEGESGDSFDKDFFSWVLNSNAEIVPVGNCENVIAATKHLGIWSTIAPDVIVAGAIDRDYRTEQEIADISSHCLVLPYHEAESYLCEPKLVSDLAEKVGSVERIPAKDEVRERIIHYCQQNLMAVAVQRATRNLRTTIDVAVKSATLSGMSESQVVERLKKQILQECHGVQAFPATVEPRFRTELITCRRAIEQRDVPKLLELFPGKELANELAKMTGCPHVRAMLRAAKHHLEVEDYDSLADLRGAIKRLSERPIANAASRSPQ